MAIADLDGGGPALKAAVPEVDVDTAAGEWKASILADDQRYLEEDGVGAFEPALLATTWKWVAEAQGVPLDKLNPETAVSRDYLK